MKTGFSPTRKKRSFSFRFLVTSVCLAILLIPLMIMSIFFYVSMQQTLDDNIQKDFSNFIKQSADMLNNDFHSVKDLYYTLLNDPIVNSELYREVTGQETDPDIRYENINARMRHITYYNNAWNSSLLRYISLIYSETSHNSIHNFPVTSMQDTGILRKTVSGFYQDLHQVIERGERIQTILYSHNPDDTLVYFAQDYYQIADYRFGGLIVMGINTDQLALAFQSILKYEGALGVVFDHENRIVFTTAVVAPGTPLSDTMYNGVPIADILKNSNSNYISVTPLDVLNLSSAVIIPNNVVFHEMQSQMRTYVLLTFILAFGFLGVGLLISRLILQYINSLITQMEKIQAGNYDVRLRQYGIRELDAMSDIFKSTSAKISHLINEVYSNEILLREAELKALQAQVNPHFLFNTLLCISWNAKANGDEQTSAMVNALSELLNSSMSFDGDAMVSLREELRIIDFYLFLQKARLGEKLQFNIDVPAEILSCLIPKLSVQPIVENAVIHGLECKTGDGQVEIRARRQESCIVITISDNGVGMDPGIVDLRVADKLKPYHHNVGLKNTHNRIKHLYGDHYGVTIESKVGAGTTVTMIVPINMEENDVSDYDHR